MIFFPKGRKFLPGYLVLYLDKIKFTVQHNKWKMYN